MKLRCWPAARALAVGLLILGLVGTVGCDTTKTTPTSAGFVIEDGTWSLRIDRFGGSENADEAFTFLPEASYRPAADGSTYRVVVSERGARVSVEGTRGADRIAITGARGATSDQRAWYELADAFAGGRFVVWQTTEGLQGELTIYGSGRPIVFSERGPLVRVP